MEFILARADAIRRQLWRLSVKVPLFRRSVRDRSLRLSLLATGHIAAAFALTAVAPLWMLLLGPLLLGVPHVASDVRYLLIRPPWALPTAAVAAALLPLAAMTALRVAAVFGGPLMLGLEAALGVAAVAAGVALTRGPLALRVAVVAILGALGALAVAHPRDTALWFAHGHNLIAFGLWLVLARGDGPWGHVLAVAACYLACWAAILAGAFDGLVPLAWGAPVAGLDRDVIAWSLAPPELAPPIATRLVTAFAFAQAVHYVVWLRLVPQRMAARRSPSSFRRSVRALRADFGAWGFGAVVLVTILLPAAALVDAPEARRIYLLLALCHGWLEVAIIAALLTDRRRRRREDRA